MLLAAHVALGGMLGAGLGAFDTSFWLTLSTRWVEDTVGRGLVSYGCWPAPDAASLIVLVWRSFEQFASPPPGTSLVQVHHHASGLCGLLQLPLRYHQQLHGCQLGGRAALFQVGSTLLALAPACSASGC